MECGMNWYIMEVYGMEEGLFGQRTENDQTIVVPGSLSESQLVVIIESSNVKRIES